MRGTRMEEETTTHTHTHTHTQNIYIEISFLVGFLMRSYCFFFVFSVVAMANRNVGYWGYSWHTSMKRGCRVEGLMNKGEHNKTNEQGTVFVLPSNVGVAVR